MFIVFMGQILNVDDTGEGIPDVPNKVVDMVAWKIFWTVYRNLQGIRINNGYNTDPLVSFDFQESSKSNYKNTLFIDTSSHDTGEHFVGDGSVPRVHQELHMTIDAVVKLDKNEMPQQMLLALEQDTRTAIGEAADGLRADIGRGGVLRYGGCQHFVAALSPSDEVGFTLDFMFRYPQGKTW